jgi:hypothetical protein
MDELISPDITISERKHGLRPLSITISHWLADRIPHFVNPDAEDGRAMRGDEKTTESLPRHVCLRSRPSHLVPHSTMVGLDTG